MRWVRLKILGPQTLVLSPRAAAPSEDPEVRRLARIQGRMWRKFREYKRAALEYELEAGLSRVRKKVRIN
ncbi:MAG TPA: hypothetical protein PLU30_25110 [Verrucomicrobiae bacterium]|mgnify:CR=1 FL=1|nr:hypothetical protein [Verrucomicrobiae bacterium]